MWARLSSTMQLYVESQTLVTTVNGQKTFKCRQCGMEELQEWVLRKHIKEAHPEKLRDPANIAPPTIFYQLGLSQKEFTPSKKPTPDSPSLSLLDSHIESWWTMVTTKTGGYYRKESFICRICAKNAARRDAKENKAEVRQHILTTHITTDPIQRNAADTAGNHPQKFSALPSSSSHRPSRAKSGNTARKSVTRPHEIFFGRPQSASAPPPVVSLPVSTETTPAQPAIDRLQGEKRSLKCSSSSTHQRMKFGPDAQSLVKTDDTAARKEARRERRKKRKAEANLRKQPLRSTDGLLTNSRPSRESVEETIRPEVKEYNPEERRPEVRHLPRRMKKDLTEKRFATRARSCIPEKPEVVVSSDEEEEEEEKEEENESVSDQSTIIFSENAYFALMMTDLLQPTFLPRLLRRCQKKHLLNESLFDTPEDNMYKPFLFCRRRAAPYRPLSKNIQTCRMDRISNLHSTVNRIRMTVDPTEKFESLPVLPKPDLITESCLSPEELAFLKECSTSSGISMADLWLHFTPELYTEAEADFAHIMHAEELLHGLEKDLLVGILEI